MAKNHPHELSVRLQISQPLKQEFAVTHNLNNLLGFEQKQKTLEPM